MKNQSQGRKISLRLLQAKGQKLMATAFLRKTCLVLLPAFSLNSNFAGVQRRGCRCVGETKMECVSLGNNSYLFLVLKWSGFHTEEPVCQVCQAIQVERHCSKKAAIHREETSK